MNNVINPFDFCESPSNSLFDAVEWLLCNKDNIERTEYFNGFVSPLYWSMPQKILKHLSKKELVWLNAETNCWNLNRMGEDTST